MKREAWEKARKIYRKNHPSSHAGYWYCHYGGGATQNPTVDHKNGRSGELGTDQDNLVDSCYFHNSLKGSKKYDVFIEFLQEHPQHQRCQ